MTLPSRLAPPMPATTSPSSTQSPRLRSFITLLPRLRILIGLPSLSIRIPFSTPSPSSSSTCSHDCSSFQHPYPHRSVRIVPFESYPIQIQRPTIPSLPTATFFPTGPGLASHPTLRPLAPTYPSSSYPPYPKLFTTAASLSHHSFSSERPFVDAPLSAASWSSNAFISYQQLQHPHHVRNHVPNRYLAPPTPPLHQPSFPRAFFRLRGGCRHPCDSFLLFLWQCHATLDRPRSRLPTPFPLLRLCDSPPVEPSSAASANFNELASPNQSYRKNARQRQRDYTATETRSPVLEGDARR
jgi:hypothetical protein